MVFKPSIPFSTRSDTILTDFMHSMHESVHRVDLYVEDHMIVTSVCHSVSLVFNLFFIQPVEKDAGKRTS